VKKCFVSSFSSALDFHPAFELVSSIIQAFYSMVGTSSHPPGVSGKSLSTYGTNPTLSPIADASSATGTQDANIDMNEVFRNLVESVEARNWMVKCLNASK